MLRRQYLFRWAAQSVAIAMSEVPEVQRVAAFGAVASPLKMEVPRFRAYQRRGIKIFHECQDLDLAVWVTGVENLKALKAALSLGLHDTQNTAFGGVAHHQVDVHLLDAANDTYRGRLCIFGQCPKPGKAACFVRNCGASPFLQQFERFRWKPSQFAGERKVTLFDRAAGFLVCHPIFPI